MSTARPISRTTLSALAAATFLSGAAGLSYEVVWSRMLVLPLGNSADATALVLCAFMAGMALGARFLGALSDRLSAPLRIYMVVEFLLAAYAVAMPLVIPLIESSPAFGGTFAAQPVTASFRLLAVFCLVAVPAFLMGGAIPVLTRILHGAGFDAGRSLGLFYGMNTLGGATGAALTGFIAIPAIGLAATSTIAAGGGLLAALIALSLRSLITASPQSTLPPPSIGADDAVSNSRGVFQAGLIVAGVGGFVTLGLEVLFARVLTFVFGHDTYAFSMLLVIVLFGLGAGGLIFRMIRRTSDRLLSPLFLAALGLLALGSFAVAAWIVVTQGRDPFGLGASGALSTTLWLEFIRELSYTPILVLLPAIAAGVSLSAACAEVAGSSSGSGRRIGDALLVNGIAAALGTLVTSLILIPRFGIEASFIILSMGAASGAVAAALIATRRLRLSYGALIPAVGTVLVAILMPADLPKSMLHEAVGNRHQTILHYEEGRTGTVSVTENRINGERQLFMNAVNEVTTRLVHDQSFKLLGHLGPLLHPAPEKGMMICYGAGISAGAALTHPFERLDVVDLSETIPRASHQFKPWNNNAIEDPRLRLHIEDGRQYLLRTSENYDVVMVDSTHPKAVDSWILYTVEFYKLARARLEDDGILVQWLPLHGLSELEFKVIVRSFLEVFPEMTVWLNAGSETYGQAAYAKLVGTLEPLRIDYRELALRLREPRIQKDLAPYGMDDAVEILDTFLTDAGHIRGFLGAVPPQTDDRPFIPYITEYSAGPRMEARSLLPVRTSVVPFLYNMGEDEPAITLSLQRAFEATGFVLADLVDQAASTNPAGRKIKLFQQTQKKGRSYYLQLASWYGDDADKLFEVASYLGNLNFTEDAIGLYDKALAMHPGDNRIRINSALARLDAGQLDAAKGLLEEAIREEPKNALAHYNLGVVLLAAGNAGDAIAFFDRAIAIDGTLLSAYVSLADAWLRNGNPQNAENILRRILSVADWRPEVWDMLGLVAAAKKNFELARQHHARALSRDPYRAASHYNMGLALMALGRQREAGAAFMAAIQIDPDDAEAENNLGLVFGTAGVYDEAIRHHLRALDIEPAYPEAAFNLGLAYKAKGLLEPAAAAFTLALEISPELEPAQKQLDEVKADSAKIPAGTDDTDASSVP